MLKDLVRTNAVRLIDRSWLNAHLEGGGALMCRQDLPETAFVPTSLAMAMTVQILVAAWLFRMRGWALVIDILMVAELKIFKFR